MKVFVTGATGWVGRHVIPELTSHGHTVLALVRTPEAASKLSSESGVTPLLGTITDLDVLATGSRQSDAVIHLAYIHDFSNMAESARVDQAAIRAIADAVTGSGKTVIGVSGMVGIQYTGELKETDLGSTTAGALGSGRYIAEDILMKYKDQGVNPIVVRLSASTFGKGDHGFMSIFIQNARKNGVMYYPGDGQQHWSTGHVLDAARLYRIAVENGKELAGKRLHATGDRQVKFKEIAEAIGKGLHVEVKSVEPAKAMEAMGFLGMFASQDVVVSHALTTEWTGWKPQEHDVLEDLARGHYFA